MKLLGRLSICFVLISMGVGNAEELTLEECISRIEAYENLFEKVQIHYRGADGKKYSNDNPEISITTTLSFDGDRWKEETEFTSSSSPEYRTSVFDGKFYKLHSWSKKHFPSQGVIDSATSVSAHSPYRHIFIPYSSGLYSYENAEIIKQTNNNVTIKFTFDYTEKIVRFDKAGDYLTISEITGKTIKGKIHPVGWQKISYDKDNPLLIEKLEYGNAVHDFHSILFIDKIEFIPEFGESFFEINFPKGTFVNNRITGERSKKS